MTGSTRPASQALASWHAFAAALTDHMARPSITSEARAIATYAEFAREMAPEHADFLITLFCRFIAQAEAAT